MDAAANRNCKSECQYCDIAKQCIKDADHNNHGEQRQGRHDNFILSIGSSEQTSHHSEHWNKTPECTEQRPQVRRISKDCSNQWRASRNGLREIRHESIQETEARQANDIAARIKIITGLSGGNVCYFARTTIIRSVSIVTIVIFFSTSTTARGRTRESGQRKKSDHFTKQRNSRLWFRPSIEWLLVCVDRSI